MYSVRDRTPRIVLYLQTVVLLHSIDTLGSDGFRGGDGDASPTGMQHFLPVKNTAMFGKLLQPEAISDSSYIKAYGDQARSGSLQRSPTDRHRAGFKGQAPLRGRERQGREGTDGTKRGR